MKFISKSDTAIIEAKKKGIRVEPDGTLINLKGFKSCSKPNNRGYVSFSVYIEGIQHKTQVHRLQAYQKFGDLVFGEGVCVRHLDGNKLNNSWDNIEIGTQSDNMMDIPKKARLESARKAAAVSRRYTDQDIRDIRRKKSEGYTLKMLAEEYTSSKGHMSGIVSKKLYPEVL